MHAHAITKHMQYNYTLVINFWYFVQEVVTATIDLEDIRSYRGRLKNYQVMLNINTHFINKILNAYIVKSIC